MVKAFIIKTRAEAFKSFMEMKKVDFNTRVCAQSNLTVDTAALRRDQ